MREHASAGLTVGRRRAHDERGELRAERTLRAGGAALDPCARDAVPAPALAAAARGEQPDCNQNDRDSQLFRRNADLR